ncbi:uncharacterized protein AMSG_01530 [Thecamonas trahens ATCC 50062]|uniref:Uncharacterized protein n=1 Tax=Thecamonas trahens ATCC 50062 TaxID=461836 RepID=A0A0L0DQV4_THETB|nr:hypothetical protein AMSG_01530 [Thecamonas trahens ATCC 50062]KNC54679.1 hypothetical protein AMSG_01530 [Thecamonas trahens ATCC 50062]|eukprot:XP_013761581.1 hypothetical protein AMSG_01530 [Thecamonas trahens ATCC 50062]
MAAADPSRKRKRDDDGPPDTKRAHSLASAAAASSSNTDNWLLQVPRHMRRVAQTTASRITTLVLEHRLHAVSKTSDITALRTRSAADAALFRHFMGALVWDEAVIAIVLTAVLAAVRPRSKLLTTAASATTSSAIAAAAANAPLAAHIASLTARTSSSLAETLAKSGVKVPPPTAASLAPPTSSSTVASHLVDGSAPYVLALIELVRGCAKQVLLLAQPLVSCLQEAINVAASSPGATPWVAAPLQARMPDSLLPAMTLNGLCAPRLVHDAALLAPQLVAVNALMSTELPPIVLYEVEDDVEAGSPCARESWPALFSRIGPVVAFRAASERASDANMALFLDGLLRETARVFPGPVLLVARSESVLPLTKALAGACVESGTAKLVAGVVAISLPAGPADDTEHLAALPVPVLALHGANVLPHLYDVAALASVPNVTLKIVADGDANLDRCDSFLRRHALSQSMARQRVLSAVLHFVKTETKVYS